MELIDYFRLFKKWGWLLFLGAFVTGGLSFISVRDQPELYTTRTTISIGNFTQSINPTSDAIVTGIHLSYHYAELVTVYDVLQATVDALDAPLTVEILRALITTEIPENTSLLVIHVVYTDPILAADIANEVAEQLILHSPANLTPEQQRQIEFANLQIDRLNEQLDGFYAELEDVDARLETTQTGEDLQQATEARNVLIGQINQATYTIAQFSVGNISLQQRSNSLEIVERARVPIVSITPGIRGPILLGILVGAGLAGGLALLIEYLDDTVRTSEEVVELLSLPILGVIVKFKSRQEKLPGPLISQDQVGSIISEGYHALRTNLLATRDSDYNGVYIVTSPSPEDGKSITAANLAIAMAWAGQRVLLIDADLRQPSIHRFFDLENNRGLTTLLMQSGTDKIDIGSDSKFAVILKDCLQDSKIANLSVITSGLPPKENPSILLGSGLMQQWIEVFRESPNIDVVLIDTPPSLAVSDSLTLSLITDSEVVLVLSADKTQRAASRKAVEQFARINRSIKGIVLNNANTRDESYYDYSYYYHTPEKT